MAITVIVAIVVCVLSIILFFKIWGMTNNVKAIKENGLPGGQGGQKAAMQSFDSALFKTMVDSKNLDVAGEYLEKCQESEMRAAAFDREFRDYSKDEYFRITTYNPVKWMGNNPVEELGEENLIDTDSVNYKNAKEIISRYGMLYTVIGREMPGWLSDPAAFLRRVNGLEKGQGS